MARKLRIVASLAQQLARKDVGQRLATLLLEEARLVTPKLQDGVSLSLSLSHSQLASRLGSVREVVTRALRKLAQQGIIETRGNRIVVLNAKELSTLANIHRRELK
jgi:CRP-like cAMP-binding protein